MEKVLIKQLNIIGVGRFSFQPGVETGFQTVISGEDLEDILVFDLEEFQEEKNIEIQLE